MAGKNMKKLLIPAANGALGAQQIFLSARSKVTLLEMWRLYNAFLPR